jgi:hypothetical protein
MADKFGRAHEQNLGQAPAEKVMDLYNNKIGRELASDPKNAGKSLYDIVADAIAKGKLQLRP